MVEELAGVSVNDGLLYCDEGGFGSVHAKEDGGDFFDPIESVLFACHILDARVGEVDARRVTDYQVPAQIADVGEVADEGREIVGYGGVQVASGNIGACSGKGSADYSAGFANNEDPGPSSSPGLREVHHSVDLKELALALSESFWRGSSSAGELG